MKEDEEIPPNDEGDAKPWQPELSALREELTDSQTQYQSLKQQTEGLSESLTQSRQELNELGKKVQSILKESAPPPPPPPPPPADPDPEPKGHIAKKESTDPGKPELQKKPDPPTPPAPEKPPHKRRSI